MAPFSSMLPLRAVFLVVVGALGLSQPVAAQVSSSVSVASEGSAVIVPYYTVNAGWQTLVNVTNTSTNSLAVKFRLHESRNGRDVLDFSIALAPRDVWTAFIQPTADGRPQLITTDRSCTIPLTVRDGNSGIGSEVSYSGEFADHSTTDGDPVRTREGYIEILVMGETPSIGAPPTDDFAGDIAYFAAHANGEPRDCGVVADAFDARAAAFGGHNLVFDRPPDTNETIPGVDSDGRGGTVQTGSGSPIAREGAALADGSGVSRRGYGPIQSARSLKVNATLVNRDTGRAAGIEPLAIAGFGLGRNLVTAQAFPWSMEPTLATGETLWTLTGLPAIAAGVASPRVSNEWSSNDKTGAVSEWVVTFPTKRFEDDVDSDNIRAACSAWRNGDTAAGVPDASGFTTAENDFGDNVEPPTCPDGGFYAGTFQDSDNGWAPSVPIYEVSNREGDSVTLVPFGFLPGNGIPAGRVAYPSYLPYVANVLRIGRNIDDERSSSGVFAGESVLGAPVAGAVETNPNGPGRNNWGGDDPLGPDATAGWVQVLFDGDYANREGSNSDAVPVTGFLYKQRDFVNPALNFGQATPHGYARQHLPPVTPD